MSTQIPFDFSLWHHQHLYTLPIHASLIKPLSPDLIRAFEEALDFILLRKPNAHLSEILQNAFNEIFRDSLCSLDFVQEWVQTFINKTQDPSEVQITLAFYALIYELYVKNNFNDSFLDFCSKSRNLEPLLVLEKKEGVLWLLGRMIAYNQLPLTTQIPFNLANCTDIDAKWNLEVIKIIDGCKDLIRIQQAQKIKLESYIAIYLTTSKENRYRAFIEMLNKVESMLKNFVLPEDVFASSLIKCVHFLPDELESSYVLRLIKILRPILSFPLSNKVSELFLSALTNMTVWQLDEFWKELRNYESNWLTSRKKKQFINLICQTLLTNTSHIDRPSTQVTSELIKTILVEKNGEFPRKYMAVVVSCMTKLEEVDKQKVMNALMIASTECKKINSPESNLREFKISLFQCAESFQDPAEKKTLYKTIKQLSLDVNYAKVPFELLGALALISSRNSSVVNKAYSIWKSHAKFLSSEIKPFFGRVFIRHLSAMDAKLAIDVLEEIAGTDLTFEKWFGLIKEVLTYYKKDEVNQTSAALRQLASIVKKILINQNAQKSILSLSLSILEPVLWIFSKLLNQKGEFTEETKELWQLAYKYSNPEMPSFLSVLVKPYLKNETLLYELVAEEACYANLNSALALLSHLKPSPARCWKKLFERIKSSTDKNLRLKAWELFLHWIENRHLQGTNHEIAEVCHDVFKSIRSLNPTCIQDVLGKEQCLFSLFTEAAAEGQACVELIYKTLLNAYAEPYSDDYLEKLVNFRTIVDGCNISPNWRDEDLRLATQLSRSLTTSWRIIAFKMMAKLNEKARAADILINFLRSAHSSEHLKTLVLPMLAFLISLPKEEHTLVLKILQAPYCVDILKQAPEESIQMLNAWNKIFSNQSDFTFIIIKIGFSLLSQLQEEISLPWVRGFVRYLGNQSSLPPKSELKQLINSKHKIVVEILDKSGESEDLLTFLKAVKRFNIYVSLSAQEIESYIRMLLKLATGIKNHLELGSLLEWIKDNNKMNSYSSNWVAIHLDLINKLIIQCPREAEKLTDNLLDILKKSTAPLGTLNPVSSQACFMLLSKAVDTKDPEIIQRVWEMFCDKFIPQGLVDLKQCANCWRISIESICPSIPNSYLNILSKLELFLKAFESFPLSAEDIRTIELLFTNSALYDIDYESEIGKKKVVEWLRAVKLLQDLKYPEINQSIQIAKYALNSMNIISGNWSPVVMPEIVEKNKLIWCQWLWKIFLSKTMPHENKQKFLNDFVNKFNIHLCQCLEKDNKMYPEVSSLYNCIFGKQWVKIKDLTSIFKTICLHPSLQLMELSILNLLNRFQFMNEDDRALIVNELDQLLAKAVEKNYIFSNDFYPACMLVAIPIFEKIKDKNLVGNMATNLVVLMLNVLKNDNVRLNKEKLLRQVLNFSCYNRACFPLVCISKRDISIKLMLTSLEIASKLDKIKYSVDIYNDFQRMIHSLYANSQTEYFTIHSFIADQLSSTACTSASLFLTRSRILKSEILHIIENKQVKEDKLAIWLDNFMFGFNALYSKNSIVLEHQKWSDHENNVKDLISIVVDKDLLPNHMDQLFQYCCMFSASPELDKITKRLSKYQIRFALNQMIERIGSHPSVMGMTMLTNLANNLYKLKLYSLKEISTCWFRALHLALNMKEKNNAFHGVLDDFKCYMYLIQQENPPEMWLSISTEFCIKAFETICDPSSSLYEEIGLAVSAYDIVNQAASCLPLFWKCNFFGNNVEVYYQLIDRLIVVCQQRLHKNCIYASMETKMNKLINLIENLNPKAIDLANAANRKWEAALLESNSMNKKD